MTPNDPLTVLHYTGYDDDRGGIVSVVRALAGTGRFNCVLGVNPGCRQHRSPALPQWELPPLTGEKIGPVAWWRARRVARRVQEWLDAEANRIFHGHSRAGLLVAWWLHRRGERRFVVTVHCYGRHRWFYRGAAGRLGRHLYWLSPAMKNYYGTGDATWAQCVPGCAAPAAVIRVVGAPGQLRLGGIGALVRWKHWHTVVRALARLPAELRSRVSFTHIGEGEADYRAELHRLAAAAAPARIVFRGAEPTAARLLGEIDVLIVASVNEPFSIAMLEALQAGVPVLAADSGGATDVIVSGRNGRFFRSGDVGDLAKQLAALLTGEGRLPMGSPADDGQRYSAPVVADTWAGIYRELARP